VALGAQGAVGLFLVLVGGLLGAPVVVVLGIAALAFDVARAIWRERGLDGVVYTRRLDRHQSVVGDEVALTIGIWNRKALPLAWLRANDQASPGVVVRERALIPGDDFGQSLMNAWTLAPYERVTRHFTLVAQRRGVHELGPVRLDVGDVFAARAASLELDDVDRWIVRPRSVPVAGRIARERWGGDERARHGLLEHPISYAGVREYRPGDPLRHVHARTSARLGRPVVKRFDPAREREVLLALDIQTVPGPAWSATFDDELVEGLCVAAASIVRQLRSEGAAFGLAVAAYAGARRSIAYLAPSESAAQLERSLDLLARLSSFPSAPFERLLTGLPRNLRPGATVIVLTGRDPGAFLAPIRRLARLGYQVSVLLHGARAEGAAPGRRHMAGGVPVRVARLDAAWSVATGLTIQ
jgi:uncharacterized protein (DUF58 family)